MATRAPLEPAYDLLHQQTRHPLDALFAPRSVAVVGASERQGSVGRTLLWNLISSPFGGTVYPINPKRTNVLGIRAWPSISALPEQGDLAVVVTPAPTVPGVIRECVEAGVKGAIIISAGFKETGPEGVRLEQEVLSVARGRMRIIGPNCLGVVRPTTGLNATFAGRHGPARQRGLHQPERRAAHRHPGLEPARGGGLQRVRLAGLHAGRGLGRSHRLPGR